MLGTQKVIVECISGNTVVEDSLCMKEKQPGVSGIQSCFIKSCGGLNRERFEESNQARKTLNDNRNYGHSRFT